MNLQDQINTLLNVSGLVSLLTLTLLEIVLGIDNIIFISIIAEKVKEPAQRKKSSWLRVVASSLDSCGFIVCNILDY